MIKPDAGSLELWLSVVRRIADQPTETLTLLDLCCNECTGTRELRCKRHVGVDVVDWVTRPHRVEFVKEDVVSAFHYWADKEFDLCICSDGIEHLSSQAGFYLLDSMTRVAKVAIIFTPLGPYMLNPDARHPDEHKSAWWPETVEAEGWKTETYPNWHQALGIGAFFAWKGEL